MEPCMDAFAAHSCPSAPPRGTQTLRRGRSIMVPSSVSGEAAEQPNRRAYPHVTPQSMHGRRHTNSEGTVGYSVTLYTDRRRVQFLNMQYSFTKACLLALATTTSVLAQIPGFNVLTAPAKNEVVEAGSKFHIEWTSTDPAAPISLILMQGVDAGHLQLASGFIAQSIDSAVGHYEWSVPADATFAAYGIKLQLDSDTTQFQYSNPFTISGGDDEGDDDEDSGPSQTAGPTSSQSTITISVSQISTPEPTTSSTSTKASSTSAKPEPTTTSEEPSSTSAVESTTAAPSTTEEPSTTLETSIAPPTSSEAPTSPPSATPSVGAAPRNAVVGGGLFGAMAVMFALL
ncbi:hypothetical protein V493_01354 [Pseudogymnoascus sp. VKM F-4281 (FW-2241)]|nr:hypothetical protein V493_01354 [Pseudogymnoascus sp. VKM F-4281 (FW-2241)]